MSTFYALIKDAKDETYAFWIEDVNKKMERNAIIVKNLFSAFNSIENNSK